MSDKNVRGSMTCAPGRYARPTVSPDLSTMPSFAHKSLTIIPISKKSKDSPQITSQNKKEMKPKLCPSVPPCVSSSYKISNEVYITPINKKEDKIISMLKKLPDISFNVLKSESPFKVPDVPEIKKKCLTNSFTPEKQTNIIFEKKVPFRSQDKNVIIDLTGSDSYDKNTLKRKQKPVVIDNISLLKNNDIQKIKKKTEIVTNKIPLPIKENMQRTSTPYKLLKNQKSSLNTKLNDLTNIQTVKQILNFSTVSHGKKQSSDHFILKKSEIKLNESLKENNTARIDVSAEGQKIIVPAFCSTNFKQKSNDSKNIETAKQNVNCLNVSHEIKQNSDDSILNKTEIKTDESLNEDYTLMNISSDGQINIVPAFRSSYLDNENVPNNENIFLGIIEQPKLNDTLFSTENYGTELSSNFSDLLGYVKTSLDTNTYNCNSN